MDPWERFVTVARGGQADRVPIALIVDSPWLPGYAGIDTLDYFLRDDEWLGINLGLIERFPEVAWVPGFWVEYGMAAEPSAFGARIVWHHDSPPAIEPAPGGLQALIQLEPADPLQHGLLPLVLQRYASAESRLQSQGTGIKMVAARGPMAIAGWCAGFSEWLLALKSEPAACHRLLDILTETIIAWLRAQLGVLRAPEGIMVLDDIVGMVSPEMFEEFVRPYFSRIFAAFDGLIKVYHNDTPCKHLLEPMSTLGFEVFNFSHKMDIALVREKMPKMALMGNIPPMELLVHGTPEQVESWARDCVAKTDGRGLILSAGGGVSPGTPAETIDALVRAVG